jgi:hypothetical protein
MPLSKNLSKEKPMSKTPVLDLLRDPSKWTKKVFAKTATGNITYPNVPDAVCWCVMGAIVKCYPNHNKQIEAVVKLKKLVPNPPDPNKDEVVYFNDHATHKELITLLEKAQI